MRDWKQIHSSSTDPPPNQGEPNLLLGYHGTTPYQSPAVEVFEEKISNISIDVHLTIQAKVNFNRRQLSLLAGQAIREVAYEGICLESWVTLEYLYSLLLGNKTDPLERKDPCERELSLLLKIILFMGSFIPLEGSLEIPKDIQEAIKYSQWVPSERTYQSRKEVYDLRKYIEVRIVPVDIFLERPKNTLRYSSYCKGYGESSHMGRRQKTPFSFELDGKEVEEEKIDLFSIPRLLDLTQLELKYSFKKKKR